MNELIEKFSFERVSKTGGIFDIDKLDWVNGHHIRDYDIDKLTKMSIPYLIESGYIDEKVAEENYDWVKTIIITIQESLSKLSEIPEKVEIFFNNEIKTRR